MMLGLEKSSFDIEIVKGQDYKVDVLIISPLSEQNFSILYHFTMLDDVAVTCWIPQVAGPKGSGPQVATVSLIWSRLTS